MNAQSPAGLLICRAFFLLRFFILCCALLYLLLLYSANSQATTAAPFLTHDQNPLTLIYGLPLPTAARLSTHQQWQLTTSLNISNTINAEVNANELLLIDVETYQLNLLLDYGLSKNWMLRFHLPMLAHSSGFLDSWIDSYHDTLNLPQHIRPSYPVDQLHIYYQSNGTTLVNVQQRATGIGDLSMQLGYQLFSLADSNLSYWASLKLPTGDIDKLTGSGSIDLAFWLSADNRLNNDNWLYGNLGLMFMSDSDGLQAVQKNTLLFANAGFQLQAWEIILLKLQLDSHSAFYDTKTKFLGPVVQLTFGGTILFDSSTLNISISEDIQTLASPDVTFNLSWKILL